ncbi:hypothetical protein [Lignipirellula cremea]|uniref:Uncharacterized protein n=1 Tax=Lignipirellula cremea TaxID=2528010 RepID=A0A518E3B8_9BACT|nr:hypothetical protein [Lignipirellula cremea]QDU98590.1 hypothetical protein Pla8534_64610 [Lignipirellula cremea]
MKNVQRAFDESGGNIQGFPQAAAPRESDLCWARLREGELPPMMFQMRLSDGRLVSYPYSDLREIRCRDAGRVQLFLLGLERLVVTIEGRRLRELANLLSRAMILWIEEADPRDLSKPESVPEIVKISIEKFVE